MEAGLIGPLGRLAVRNVSTIAEGLVPTLLRALEENIVSGSISKLETAQTGFVKVRHSQISIRRLFLSWNHRYIIEGDTPSATADQLPTNVKNLVHPSFFFIALL